MFNMKGILKGIALLVLVGISGQAVSATYDEVFPSVKLRYNHGYGLFDTFYNGSSEVEITSVRGELTGDYTRNGIPDFVATEWLLDKTTKVHDGIGAKVIPAYGTGKILKTESNYDISYIPEERKDDNITVLYTIEYRKKVGGVYEYKTHTEFKPYEITWCGDGIKDSVYEQCDGTDGISDGQTCSNTCEIIDAPVPVCNSISPTTVTGGMLDNGSFTTGAISCDVSNSTGHTVTVNCANGTTVSNGQSCTYTTTGNYSPYCMINGVAAGNQCTTSTTVDVVTPDPSYTIAKVDFNSNDNDGQIGDLAFNDRDPNPVTGRDGDSQRLNVGDDAVFKIYVENTGNVALTNVEVTDDLVSSCSRKGANKIGTLAVGQIVSYTCSKENAERTDFPAGENIATLSSNELPDLSNASGVLFENPSCTGLSQVSSNGAIAPSNSTFTCTGENHTNFEVKYYSDEVLVKTFSTETYPGSSYVDTFSGLDDGDYVVTCTVDNEPLQDLCIDEFTLSKPLIPSISIDKTAIDGTENQTVNSGGRAEFKIVVKNTGDTDLAGPFTLTDPKVESGNCSGVVDLPSDITSTFENFDVYGVTGYDEDHLLQQGESFEYTCYEDDVEEETFDGFNTISVSAPTVDTVSDDTYIDVLPAPVCESLTLEATTRVVPFDSGRIVCTGNSEVSTDYTITISQNGDVVHTENEKETRYDFEEAGDYVVTCTLTNDLEVSSNTCELPLTTVADTEPAIGLVKTDYNEAIDSDSREDYQEIPSGSSAVFKITVSNDGDEALTDLELFDTTNISVDGREDHRDICGGTVNLTTKKLSSGLDIVYSGTGSNLEIGESFYYICTLDNTEEGYTNTAEVTANSVVDGAPVGAENPSHVLVGIYDLALVKTVDEASSTLQKDGTVVFDITVENQGSIDATNIVVTDYIPEGLTLAAGQPSWAVSGNEVTRNIGNIDAGTSAKTVSIIFDITAEEGTITNWAEITETGENLEDCDSPENNEGVMSTTGVVNDAIGSGCGDADGSDEDDHDYEEIIISKYDLALIKTVVDVKDEYLPGDSVTFNIEVTNQGQVDATNVVVTDYIPDGLEIVDPDNLWLVAQDNRVTRVVGDVTTSLPQSVQITFTVIGGTGDTITNIAEIYSDDGEDCDSFTDDEQNNSDDEMGTDFTNANTNPTGCNPDDGDEDDHDIAVINVGTTPGEYDLALVKTISDDTLDYEPGGSVTFEIEVINQGTESVSDIEITDYNPTGLTFSTLSGVNTGWTIDPTSGHSVYTIADTIAGGTSADIIEITFLIDEDATGTVYNYAEISEDNIDDCDSYADNEDGNTSGEETDNIIDNDVGDGCNPGGDEDDHDLAPVVISEEGEYDLALIKTLSDDTIEYNVGDPVTFDIEVINQGRGSVINVEIIDYIPDYLRLAPQENGVNTGWSKVGDNAVYTITDTITGNTSADIVQITFIIEEGATGTIYNTAEISEDNVEDCDSTADNEDGNTSGEETDNIIDNDVGGECEEGGDEDDHDIAPVVIGDDLKYDLALVKKVLNPTADYQSSDGVVFEIEVFNQGDIDATGIKVTDYVQDGLTFKDESGINTGWTYDEATDNASYTISETIASGDSKVIEITFTIDAGATDGEVLYNYAEISEDNGEDCDSTPDATNQSDAGEDADLDESAEGSQCQTTADEDDHDRADVVIGGEDVYDLALVKKVLNPSTDYQSGDDVTFEIEVFNQGDIDATGIKVTDYVQTGLRFKDESGTNTGWTYDDSTDNALYVISNTIASGDSETIEITFTIDAGMSDGDVLYNYAEISEDNGDDCDSTPDDTNQSDAGEDADLDESTEGSQCQTTADEDDHDRADVVIGGDISAIGRIKIEKYSNQGTLDQDGDKTKTVTDDSQLIDNGTSALFNIKITNTGDVDLINIEVTDIYDDTTCNLDSLSLAAGSAPHIYDCERDFTTDDYTNTVSVTAVNADTGEAIPVDADDSDVTYVKVPGPRVCVSGCGPGTPAICENIEEESLTRFTCSGNSKSKFIAIDCDGDGLYEENVHKREATLEGGIYSYTFTCNNLDVDNNIIELTPKCAVSDSSRPSVGIAHAGWSSRFQCTHTKDSEEICGNTKVEPDNGETCDVGAVSTTECYGTDAGVGKQCTAPGKDSCLDPDYALLNPLECGDCSNSVYYDANEAFCTIVTNPDERTLEITSISDFAIGEQNVFKHDVAKNRYGFNTPGQEENYLKVENTGEKAIYLNDRLCLVDMGNNLEPWTRNVGLNQNLISPTASVPGDINGGSSGVKTWCQSHVIGWIYPNYDDQGVEFDNSHYYRTSDIADIVGNPSGLDVDGNTSDTTRLVLTVKGGTAPFTSNGFDYPGDLNELYVWSPVLSGDIYVTVSNPGIESPVGGLSYIKDAGETSSISEIVAKVNNNGKTVITNTDQQNFVTTLLGSGSNQSEVDTITDSSIVAAVEDEGDALEDNSVSEITTIINTNFEKYQGLSNVFAKRGDVTIDTAPVDGGAISKTFIIENGDLNLSDILDGTIESGNNIAYIVKGGDINIDANVSEINGTFIAIPLSGVGGNITSDNTDTPLTVNGSLYGNLTRLTENRTHISMASDGTINVGTVISYGSNLLSKPAPLVGQFINDSLEAQKIAQ